MHAKCLTAITGNMTPYVVAAFFYLLVTLPLTKFVGNLERRMDDPSHGRTRKAAKPDPLENGDETDGEPGVSQGSTTDVAGSSTRPLDSEHVPIATESALTPAPQTGNAR